MAAVAAAAAASSSTGMHRNGNLPSHSGTSSSTMVTESQLRIDALAQSLRRMAETTTDLTTLTDGLTRRARHLDSLTSPASETSAMLTQSANNLNSTLGLMKDAREKFDTVQDCEPAIQRLLSGAQEATALFEASGGAKAAAAAAAAAMASHSDGATVVPHGGNLTEQDVYAAVDSMDIIRDAYTYFLGRRTWRSAPSALGGLERSHTLGVDAMCLLIGHHLKASGAAVRLKRGDKKGGGKKKDSTSGGGGSKVIPTSRETAAETRLRLSAALQNRDLMKSVGEYEECLPLDSRPVRELRAVFECLGGEAAHLGPNPMDMVLRSRVKPEMSKVVRTEKVGSGGYCNLVNQPLGTGFPQLDAFGEARKTVAHASIDGYYRHTKAERKKSARVRQGSGGGATDDRGAGGSLSDVDAAARDAVRCLEHAMVVVAGEKSVYRCVVSPTSSSAHSHDKVGGVGSREYRDGLVMAYSYVVAAVVDRAMDIIETVFLKDAKTATPPVPPKDGVAPTDPNDAVSVRVYGSAAAAGLRMLDGVRMLGPSLAKLCDMSHDKDKSGGGGGGGDSASIASNLCIAIHRTTVKNAARTLENLAKAIQADPLDGEKHRPRDARVATVSSDVVRAIRLVSPFTSAYKSVTKRRALPWDPKMGDESNDLDSYVRFLIMRLLNSLQGKALNYTKDPGADASAKSTLFMMNNTFYLLEQLGATSRNKTKQLPDGEIDGDTFRIESSWFRDKVGKIFEAEKTKYVQHWEVLNSHLTSVDKNELSYQGGSDKLLSLESGRLIKARFAGFIEDFEKLYSVHQPLAVVDPKLRTMLQRDVMNVFYPRYTRFFEKYSRIQFSKKNMDQYLKYPPARVETMLSELFAAQ
eukprot:CAMPEP_0181031546 /NCGR_PEP_ID=MMETSP1070-20121207/6288_1 /TAXON_ID=265543 /ORGANISM="Minutocellus polymorphus, Strain NH13" /LENGTH=864 /DNA_ID=CAMNT_0023108927 /DNA_START=198 /DNA_END=2792 /DNA_ORIENTATION=-